MKLIIIKCIIILLSVNNCLNAQHLITGKILEDEKPVYGIEVILYDENKKPLKSSLTDDNGGFSIETNKGNYLLEARLLGKILYAATIQMNNASINIGTITVNTKSELGEVVLTGQKKLIERKVDRLVFNVGNTILAKGSNAFDVLRITPLVKIENETLTIVGKSDVMVMVNDKLLNISGEMLKNYLNNIPSENIKSIEVITNPSARYAAEGTGGIINIVLIKPILEFSQLTLRSNAVQAKFFSFGNGIGYMYKKNKVSTLIDVNYSNSKSLYTNDIEFNYSDNNTNNDVFKTKKSDGLGLLANLDYEINKKQNIGFQITYSNSNNNSDENNLSNIYNLNNTLTDNFVINSNTTGPNKNFSTNINYEVKLDTLGKKINLDLDYFRNNFTKDNTLFSEKYSNNSLIHSKKLINNGDQKIGNYSFRANLEYPTKKFNLNFGTKVSFTNFDNLLNSEFSQENNNTFITFLKQENRFQYNENINALYVDVNKNINEHWSIKFGLRNEYIIYQTNSISTNEKEKNYYNKMFPTLYINYNRNENNSFSLNYGRRINRPRFGNLNPAKWYLNENSIESGNPFLQPSFSHNFEFSHTYKSKITTYLIFTKSNQNYGQLINHENNNTQEFIRKNYFDREDITFYQYYAFKFNNRISTSINYYISYFETQSYSNLLEPNFTGFATNFSKTTTFILDKQKTLLAQLIFEYNPNSKSNESLITQTYNLVFLLQYRPNKKITILLNAQDITKSNFSTMSSISKNVNQSFTQYYDTQRVSLSLNYTFGNDKAKVKQHKIANEEEKNRAKE